MPILRTEIARIEIAPDKVLVVDRMNKRYVRATKDELKDILPTFLTSLTVAFIMWCVSLLDWSVYLLLPIQLVLGILLAFFIYEKIKLPEYLELKQLGISLLKRK